MNSIISDDGAILYSYGLPFSEKLGFNIRQQMDRVKRKKASLIILDGGQGEGKTTLAIHIMDYVNKLSGLDPVKLELKDHPQLSMGGAEFAKNLLICYKSKMPIVTYDEAGDFNRRGALTRFNADINRVFETFRAYRVIVILCLPSFQYIDNDLTEKKIPRFMLHLYGRKNTSGHFKAYSLKCMYYLKHRMKNLVIKEEAFGKQDPNYMGHFKDLSPARSKKLDILSTEGKKSIAKMLQVEREGILSYSMIAQKTSLSIYHVHKLIKQMREKPIKTIDKVIYFDKGVVNRLLDFKDGLR